MSGLPGAASARGAVVRTPTKCEAALSSHTADTATFAINLENGTEFKSSSDEVSFLFGMRLDLAVAFALQPAEINHVFVRATE